MITSLFSTRHDFCEPVTTTPRPCLLLVVLLLCATLIAGCGPAVRQPSYPGLPTDESPRQEEYRPVTGRGGTLFQQAQAAQQAGRYAEAEMLLERALRIEPQNPHYWYAMAAAKFDQGQFPQTIQLCLKAESLAGSQPQIAARSRTLLQKAQAAMAAR